MRVSLKAPQMADVVQNPVAFLDSALGLFNGLTVARLPLLPSLNKLLGKWLDVSIVFTVRTRFGIPKARHDRLASVPTALANIHPIINHLRGVTDFPFQISLRLL